MARVPKSSISALFRLSRKTWISSSYSLSLSPSSSSSSPRKFLCGLFGCNPDLHFRFYSSKAAADWDLLGAREYLEYRMTRYGDITLKALLVDAVGTLLVHSQPMAQIYRQIAEKYGVRFSKDEILNRYRWAYEQP